MQGVATSGRWRRWGPWVALGAACATSACTSSQEPGRADVAGSRLTATLVQQRFFEGTRTVGVQVTNRGRESLQVTSVRLEWSALPAAASTPKHSLIGPGQTVDLLTAYGRPDCSRYPTMPHDSAVGELELAGEPDPVRLTLAPAGQRLLRRLFGKECERAALRAVAEVHLLDRWSRVSINGSPFLRGTLALDRSAGGPDLPVTVVGLRGSVLLSFRALTPARPLGTLSPGETDERVPVLVGSSGRCDAHALGGSTQTFLLSVFVRRGDRPAHRLVLVPRRPVQGRALEVVADACT
jgi:hypothetical protein